MTVATSTGHTTTGHTNSISAAAADRQHHTPVRPFSTNVGFTQPSSTVTETNTPSAAQRRDGGEGKYESVKRVVSAVEAESAQSQPVRELIQKFEKLHSVEEEGIICQTRDGSISTPLPTGSKRSISSLRNGLPPTSSEQQQQRTPRIVSGRNPAFTINFGATKGYVRHRCISLLFDMNATIDLEAEMEDGSEAFMFGMASRSPKSGPMYRIKIEKLSDEERKEEEEMHAAAFDLHRHDANHQQQTHTTLKMREANSTSSDSGFIDNVRSPITSERLESEYTPRDDDHSARQLSQSPPSKCTTQEPEDSVEAPGTKLFDPSSVDQFYPNKSVRSREASSPDDRDPPQTSRTSENSDELSKASNVAVTASFVSRRPDELEESIDDQVDSARASSSKATKNLMSISERINENLQKYLAKQMNDQTEEEKGETLANEMETDGGVPSPEDLPQALAEQEPAEASPGELISNETPDPLSPRRSLSQSHDHSPTCSGEAQEELYMSSSRAQSPKLQPQGSLVSTCLDSDVKKLTRHSEEVDQNFESDNEPHDLMGHHECEATKSAGRARSGSPAAFVAHQESARDNVEAEDVAALRDELSQEPNVSEERAFSPIQRPSAEDEEIAEVAIKAMIQAHAQYMEEMQAVSSTTIPTQMGKTEVLNELQEPSEADDKIADEFISEKQGNNVARESATTEDTLRPHGPFLSDEHGLATKKDASHEESLSAERIEMADKPLSPTEQAQKSARLAELHCDESPSSPDPTEVQMSRENEGSIEGQLADLSHSDAGNQMTEKCLDNEVETPRNEHSLKTMLDVETPACTRSETIEELGCESIDGTIDYEKPPHYIESGERELAAEKARASQEETSRGDDSYHAADTVCERHLEAPVDVTYRDGTICPGNLSCDQLSTATICARGAESPEARPFAPPRQMSEDDEPARANLEGEVVEPHDRDDEADEGIQSQSVVAQETGVDDLSQCDPDAYVVVKREAMETPRSTSVVEPSVNDDLDRQEIDRGLALANVPEGDSDGKVEYPTCTGGTSAADSEIPWASAVNHFSEAEDPIDSAQRSLHEERPELDDARLIACESPRDNELLSCEPDDDTPLPDDGILEEDHQSCRHVGVSDDTQSAETSKECSECIRSIENARDTVEQRKPSMEDAGQRSDLEVDRTITTDGTDWRIECEMPRAGSDAISMPDYRGASETLDEVKASDLNHADEELQERFSRTSDAATDDENVAVIAVSREEDRRLPSHDEPQSPIQSQRRSETSLQRSERTTATGDVMELEDVDDVATAAGPPEDSTPADIEGEESINATLEDDECSHIPKDDGTVLVIDGRREVDGWYYPPSDEPVPATRMSTPKAGSPEEETRRAEEVSDDKHVSEGETDSHQRRSIVSQASQASCENRCTEVQESAGSPCAASIEATDNETIESPEKISDGHVSQSVVDAAHEHEETSLPPPDSRSHRIDENPSNEHVLDDQENERKNSYGPEHDVESAAVVAAQDDVAPLDPPLLKPTSTDGAGHESELHLEPRISGMNRKRDNAYDIHDRQHLRSAEGSHSDLESEANFLPRKDADWVSSRHMKDIDNAAYKRRRLIDDPSRYGDDQSDESEVWHAEAGIISSSVSPSPTPQGRLSAFAHPPGLLTAQLLAAQNLLANAQAHDEDHLMIIDDEILGYRSASAFAPGEPMRQSVDRLTRSAGHSPRSTEDGGQETASGQHPTCDQEQAELGDSFYTEEAIPCVEHWPGRREYLGPTSGTQTVTISASDDAYDSRHIAPLDSQLTNTVTESATQADPDSSTQHRPKMTRARKRREQRKRRKQRLLAAAAAAGVPPSEYSMDHTAASSQVPTSEANSISFNVDGRPFGLLTGYMHRPLPPQ